MRGACTGGHSLSADSTYQFISAILQEIGLYILEDIKKLFRFFLFGSNALKSLQILSSFFILPCICHPLKTDANSFFKEMENTIVK